MTSEFRRRLDKIFKAFAEKAGLHGWDVHAVTEVYLVKKQIEKEVKEAMRDDLLIFSAGGMCACDEIWKEKLEKWLDG